MANFTNILKKSIHSTGWHNRKILKKIKAIRETLTMKINPWTKRKWSKWKIKKNKKEICSRSLAMKMNGNRQWSLRKWVLRAQKNKLIIFHQTTTKKRNFKSIMKCSCILNLVRAKVHGYSIKHHKDRFYSNIYKRDHKMLIMWLMSKILVKGETTRI